MRYTIRQIYRRSGQNVKDLLKPPFIGILWFICSLTGMPSGWAASDVEASEHTWYRILPHEPLSPIVNFFYAPEIDDFYVLYVEGLTRTKGTSSDETELRYDAISFFQGRILTDVTPMTMVTRFEYRRPKPALVLKNGRTIRTGNLDGRINTRCPQGLNSYIEIVDESGNVVAQKSLLYLLRDPVDIEIDERCASDLSPSFKQRIVSLGGGVIDLMNDGTFFVAGPTFDNHANIILRLKVDLTIPGVCENPNIVIVDTKDISQMLPFEEMSYQEAQEKARVLFLAKRESQCH